MRRQIVATQQPLPARWLEANQIASGVETGANWRLISRMVFPSITTVVAREARAVAVTRVAATALAVERYRLANGSLPTALAELVPAFLAEVPSDPFTGASLQYRLCEPGFVVYSVGEDQHDDGGTERGSRGSLYQPGTDIVFKVER